MLQNIGPLHILIALSFLLILVPIAGISFSLLFRQKQIAAGLIKQTRHTNPLAIAALVFAFVGAVPGVVCGHIALGQIKNTQVKNTQDRGWGLAVTSLWVGYYLIAVVGLAAVILLGASMAPGV
ncbi:MAG: DUF4190 domain-containing protein [Cryobacterium sp.]